MTRSFDYRAVLRAKGIKPIPAVDRLRTHKKPDDYELCSGGKIYVHRERK